jgi:hypothetical protein
LQPCDGPLLSWSRLGSWRFRFVELRRPDGESWPRGEDWPWSGVLECWWVVCVVLLVGGVAVGVVIGVVVVVVLVESEMCCSSLWRLVVA